MGLLITEINELRDLLTRFDDGGVSVEDLNAKMNIYTQTEKRARLILNAWAVGMKHGVTGFDKAVGEGLIGTEKINQENQLYNRTPNRGSDK